MAGNSHFRPFGGEMATEKVVLIPELGDLVFYRPLPAEKGEAPAILSNQPDVLPAVVVAVWTPDCVNLKVFTDGPTDVWKTSILQGDHPGMWQWGENYQPG
jgi:hypothetical protein